MKMEKSSTLQIAVVLTSILLLTLAGCQNESEQPQTGRITISIQNTLAYGYDSVFASVAQNGVVFWQNSLTLSSDNKYQATVDVIPDSDYTVQGWAYVDGFRCYAGNSQPFDLSLNEGKYIALNMQTQLAPPPYNLNADTTSTPSINLFWIADTSSLLQGFIIERGQGSVSALQVVDSVNAQARSYANPGLIPNIWYYFRVRSYNPAGFTASNVDSAKIIP